MNHQAISLYELNNLIKNVLTETLPETFWIRVEMSDVRVNQNGHCYLEFIEKDGKGKILVAKARGMIWANTFYMLKAYFENATKQPFASGLKVLVQVSVEFHELYGFSLTVHDIDPSYTLGDQALNRAAILRQLEEDGVLSLNKELELSVPLNRIAVISSPTAAGYEDFLDQLHNNVFGFVFYTKLFPAIMQGDRSEDSIISALERIYEYQDCFDAVVIIRGGGATSDLSSFDSYLLAASCAQFPLPIITGIGHERDETVLDIVAHTRAKTPTAVAEFLIDNMSDAAVELNELAHSIVQSVQHRLQDETLKLNTFETQNNFVLKAWYKEQEAVLSSARLVLTRGMQRIARDNKVQFAQMEETIKRKLQQNDKNAKENLIQIGDSLKKMTRQLYKDEAGKLDMFEKHLQLSSPENILKKGYTLTMKDGKVIKQKDSLKSGDKITTTFYNGEIESIVK
ncbi:exodeoxyribonuclease VII large subunit [Dysgonomonas sp. PFB1-18]|uniref:exodeoxyribonuclease VII large subunit n=1 Tax=unclassified Dysgonomonas TaxID=2630389 RepID=UPI00247702B1|nr:MULTISPECIES: exodeoxyribonuclease VII large subunit [unclassified Dysgonomonas]MDH6307380.1 exodeoxyribonuclease VII large subunit [Dysgonomonas sp. PF1-14]MDH6337298.1 exodeoxyribonuclease VII large subunit [Dysgonomonas sp. PF1-16]MDH6379222.1 exodeoxyribonuclease VII large subunit [Dysgonomonas sp. PFB1-18]MDH6396140.1 exodeoxyribonuclease VII large subunit [Dysgonomonas sp. PF1-23]